MLLFNGMEGIIKLQQFLSIMCHSCVIWICVCIVFHIDNSKFSSMDCMINNTDGTLCVYSFILNTIPDDLCDPHCISGDTFIGLG
jgi:hypothetical protein